MVDKSNNLNGMRSLTTINCIVLMLPGTPWIGKINWIMIWCHFSCRASESETTGSPLVGGQTFLTLAREFGSTPANDDATLLFQFWNGEDDRCFKWTTNVPSSKFFDLIIFKVIPLFWQSLVPGVKHMALLTSFLLLKNLMHRQQEQKYNVDWWILELDHYDRNVYIWHTWTSRYLH